MITSIHRSALLMHSAQQMFHLVNDVAAYPQYMKGCVGSEVIESTNDMMLARLDLKSQNIHYSFSTRNRLVPYELIELNLEEGPFKKLNGQWVFKALTDKACKVSLELAFEFKSLSLSIASSSLFASVANNLLDAVVARADKLYS